MRTYLLVSLSVALLFSCGRNTKSDAPEVTKNPDVVVVVETSIGTIKVKLYNETPYHRDNFIKLSDEGFYDGIIFHRVINNFMIQAGDPKTKQAEKDAVYGEGDTGYTIPAEFVSKLFHKKGALAAARMGDDVNPTKESSGSQFYIVQGKIFSPEQLTLLINNKNERLKSMIFNKLITEKASKLMSEGNQVDYKKLSENLSDTLQFILSKTTMYSFTPEQVQIYTTIGGTPHLDGDYTVFGEVIEGIDTVDKIAAVNTDNSDRPITNVVITKMYLEKK